MWWCTPEEMCAEGSEILCYPWLHDSEANLGYKTLFCKNDLNFDLSPFTFEMWGLQARATMSFLYPAGELYMLSKHSTNWAATPAPPLKFKYRWCDSLPFSDDIIPDILGTFLGQVQLASTGHRPRKLLITLVSLKTKLTVTVVPIWRTPVLHNPL